MSLKLHTDFRSCPFNLLQLSLNSKVFKCALYIDPSFLKLAHTTALMNPFATSALCWLSVVIEEVLSSCLHLMTYVPFEKSPQMKMDSSKGTDSGSRCCHLWADKSNYCRQNWCRSHPPIDDTCEYPINCILLVWNELFIVLSLIQYFAWVIW